MQISAFSALRVNSSCISCTPGGDVARSFTGTNVLFGVDLIPCLELGCEAFVALGTPLEFRRLHPINGAQLTGFRCWVTDTV